MANKQTKTAALNKVAAKYSSKPPVRGTDPSTKPREPVQGKGEKTYSGTGQNRTSSRAITPEQRNQIFAGILAEVLNYNNANSEMISTGGMGGIDPQAEAANPRYYQPASQPDPWRMDSPRNQGGGIGPAGLGNAESEYFGPGGGTWMDKLSGHPGGGTLPPRTFRR